MAVVAVTFDGARIDAADVVGSDWDNWGTSQKAAVNPDFFLQGVGSISEKVTTVHAGVELDGSTPVDLATTPRGILFKFLITTTRVLLNRGPAGCVLYLGSAQGDYYEYWAQGGDTYPATKSWLVLLVDPNLVGYRAGTTGTPSLTAADYFGLAATMSGTVKDDNVAMDAVDHVDIGEGLTLIGGDGGSTDGVFADFLLEDEGDVDNNWNVVNSIETVIFVSAMLTIGSATATVFQDSNRTLIFLDGLIDSGSCGIAFGMSNAAQDIDFTGITMIGRGVAPIKRFFDSEVSVASTGTFEEIDVIAHGLSKGDYITYSREGGSDDIGPDPGDFWAGVVSVDKICLFANFADAFNFEAVAADWATLITISDVSIDVDGVTEEITISGHGLTTGQPVLYDDDGGAQDIGLVTDTVYWANVIDGNTLSIHDSLTDAKSDTSRHDLITGGGVESHHFHHTTQPEAVAALAAPPGENHSIVKKYDSRPDLTATGTDGALDFANCTEQGFGTITLTSVWTILNGFIITTTKIVMSTGTIDGIGISEQTTEEGVGLVSTATLANIKNNTFTLVTADEGHAVEITAAGTYTYLGNTHTGYWTHGGAAEDGATFGSTSGVNGTSEVITTAATHGLTTGDAVFYGDEGGSQNIGLTDGAKYYANVISTTTLSLHLTRASAVADSSRLDLTAGGAETHAIYSSRAAILNSSGGLVTINVGGGGDTPTVRNTPGGTAAVNNDVTVTFDKMKDNTEVRVFNAGTETEVAGIENATAGSQDDRSFAFTQPASTSLDYRLLNKTGFLNIEVRAFTMPSSDATIDIQQQVDRNFFNPP